MYTSNVKDLLNIAEKLCNRFGVLCSEQNEFILKFALTWIENFYYVDPRECISDLTCIEKIFDMHSKIISYVYRNEYLIKISDETIKTVEKLINLRENSSIV